MDINLNCFVQPTLELKPFDIILFSINIFSYDYFIDFDDISFKIKLQKNLVNIPSILSEINKINTKSKIDYTQFNLFNGRINEFEYLKSKWRDISNFEDSDDILEYINRIFKPFFKIKKACFDDVGFFLFKFSLTAINKGILCNGNDLGIKIKIKEEKDYTVNEIKKNNLIYEKSDMIQIRIGDTVIFYFSLPR